MANACFRQNMMENIHIQVFSNIFMCIFNGGGGEAFFISPVRQEEIYISLQRIPIDGIPQYGNSQNFLRY
jgi:hypothetical protein